MNAQVYTTLKAHRRKRKATAEVANCYERNLRHALVKARFHYAIWPRVLQVRRRSRADEAGLNEGDVLLTVNGKTCDGLSCGQAMDLVESSGQNVVVRVTRSRLSVFLTDFYRSLVVRFMRSVSCVRV